MKNKTEEYNSDLIDEILDSITPKEKRRVKHKMLLAARIEDAMKAKGWNKSRLLQELGQKNASVATKWFSGTHNFTVDTLFDIQEALGIKLINISDKQAIKLEFHLNITTEPETQTNDGSHDLIDADGETNINNSYKSMSTQKNQNIKFQQKGIEILDSAISTPEKPIAHDAVFSFDITIEQKFNIEKSLVFVICNISTTLLDKPEHQLGKIKSSCIFKVNDLSDYFTEEKSIKLPNNFIITLNSVSISTTRGLMYSAFRGTLLHKAVLPLIDPKQYDTTEDKK